jgi:hypothetical protein
MVLGIIMILLAGAIAYYHYVQGFFSATLSATFATIAAAVAVGWHETLVEALLAGRYADQANAMAVCTLFGATYLILRLVTDKFVYGNVRLPVLAEKIGAGVMGVIVGLLATGVVAYAAQSLPMAPSVGMYSRLPITGERSGFAVPPLPGKVQSRDGYVYDELAADTMTADQSGMFVPVDEFVLGAVSMMSEGGLAGDRTVKSVHPDWLLELFGQRLGIQPGAKRSALNVGSKWQVTVGDKVTVIPSIEQRDGELPGIRSIIQERRYTPKGEGRALIVVEAKIARDASDADSLTRFSPGSVRLVGTNGREHRDYFPIGTIDKSGVLVFNKPDDYLFVDYKASPDGAVAFAFDVDFADVSGADSKAVRPGVFFEFKRYGREDLTGLAIVPPPRRRDPRHPRPPPPRWRRPPRRGPKAATSCSPRDRRPTDQPGGGPRARPRPDVCRPPRRRSPGRGRRADRPPRAVETHPNDRRAAAHRRPEFRRCVGRRRHMEGTRHRSPRARVRGAHRYGADPRRPSGRLRRSASPESLYRKAPRRLADIRESGLKLKPVALN